MGVSGQREAMSKIGFYLDADNLWIQGKALLLPNYCRKSNTLDGVEISDELKCLINKHSLELWEVVEKIICEEIGCHPEFKHVAANWQQIDDSPKQRYRIEKKLRDQNYDVINPAAKYPSLHANDVKKMSELADRELIYAAFDDSIDSLIKKNGMHGIALCTGDHFAGRLATYLQDRFQFKIYIACFRGSASMVMQQEVERDPENKKIIFLDEHAYFEEFRDRFLNQLGKEKPVVSLEDAMVKSLIFRLNETALEYVTKKKLSEWIRGWLLYYNTKLNDLETVPGPNYWIKYFVAGQLITIEPNRGYVLLNTDNKLVRNSIQEIVRDSEVYYSRWHVAPARRVK